MTADGCGVSVGVGENVQRRWLSSIVNVPKATAPFAFKCLMLYYVNFTLIK